MDLEQYKQDALRTEAGAVDEIVANEVLVTSVIEQVILAGQMLDQVKKHVFYKRPYNTEQLQNNIDDMQDIVHRLAALTPSEMDNDEVLLDINPRIFHGVVGKTTEVVEMLEALRFNGEPMDLVNMLEEIGDDSWYTAILMDETDTVWDDVLHRNIAKLRHRFPEKFDTERANMRDLSGERDILESD